MHLRSGDTVRAQEEPDMLMRFMAAETVVDSSRQPGKLGRAVETAFMRSR